MPKMAKIVVDVGEQMNGITFRLSPKTRAFLSPRLTKIARLPAFSFPTKPHRTSRTIPALFGSMSP